MLQTVVGVVENTEDSSLGSKAGEAVELFGGAHLDAWTEFVWHHSKP